MIKQNKTKQEKNETKLKLKSFIGQYRALLETGILAVLVSTSSIATLSHRSHYLNNLN